MKNSKINIRQIALPTEHGSWGFVLEPLILSLLVAYSFPGLILGFCTFFMFLSHQPLKNILKRKKQSSYNKASFIVLGIYSLFIVSLFAIVFFQVSIDTLIPFGAAVVIMMIYITSLYLKKNRELISELSAPISISLITLSIVLFAEWRLINVLVFFFILLARSIPTTFYVHAKLLMIKKKPAKKLTSILQGILFTLILLLFSILGYSPYLAVFASLLLLIRAYWGLYVSKEKVKVKVFGIWEFIYGGLFVLIVAAGYILNI